MNHGSVHQIQSSHTPGLQKLQSKIRSKATMCHKNSLEPCCSLKKLYQHRPQTVLKRFVWTSSSQKTSNIDFLVRPAFPPGATCFINDFCRHRYRYLFGHTLLQSTGPQRPATEFRVAAKTRTRGGQGPDTEPGHGAQPQSSGARPRQGQEEDKAWTQSRATEPGHRVQGRGQEGQAEPGHRALPQSSGARPVRVASFFSKIEPQH